ncbi:MAG: hypothetical protein VCC67_05260 [Myxococcota bacterium]
MRIVVTIAVAVLGASLYFRPSVPFKEIRSIESADDALALIQGPPDAASVALEARCGGLQERMRQTCEATLTARFASGEASPESLIRIHCTRVESVWDAPLPEPPAVCIQRFGGWLSG